MSRNDLKNDILAYADGELTGSRAAAVEQAMAESAEVRAEVEQWRQLRQAAQRALFASDAPRDMRRRIAAQLDVLKPAKRRDPGTLIFKLYQPMMAAAAAIVIAFGFYFLGPSSSGQAIADPLQFPKRHMICLRGANFADELHIRDMSPKAAQDMLTKQHKYTVLVPDLSQAGWKLMAGRDCGIECGPENALNRPYVNMVHVFYTSVDDPKKSLSLFSVERRITFPKMCSRAKGECPNRMYSQTCRRLGNCRFSVLSWCEPQNTYAACGEMPVEELRELLDDVHLAIANNQLVLAEIPQ